MAYLLFHYKCQASYGAFYPYDEDPRNVISAGCVAVYEDGTIITYDKNLLDQKINEKIICKNISVTNQIADILEANKWKIRFIPKYLGFWGFDAPCEDVWLKNRHFQGIYFLNYQKKTGKEFKKWAKKIKDDDITDWRKIIRWGKSINKFRDVYDEIRKILIANGMPENCMST